MANAYVRYIYMFLYMYVYMYVYGTVLKFIFMRYEQKSSMLVLYTYFQLASHILFCVLFIFALEAMLPKVSSCYEITYISLAHTYIHTSHIHTYVCVSSICLYLPHRPHILDGTNRVLSCLFYLAYFQRMAFCVLKMFCILCNIAKEWKRDRQYVSVRGEKSKEFQSISTDFVSHPTI